MNSDTFVEVFNVSQTGYRDWSFPAFGLIFVAIGIGLFFGPSIIRGMGIPYLKFPSAFRTVFRFFFLGFAIFWVGTAFFATYSSYARHRHLADSNQCTQVEGPVDDFVPMPYTGHADESFSVSGVKFSYSDYGVTDAFNNTASHGGPISADSYVRICYDPQDHAILRLAIRGFRGKVPNYSAVGLLFSDEPKQVQSEAAKSTIGLRAQSPKFLWLGDIWMAMWAADAIAVLSLFVPYLRTFWKVGAIEFEKFTVPEWLPKDRKFKLRNNLALWNSNEGEIWVRPRGFNFLRLPSMVARFVTSDNRVIEGELRFSSGLPFVFLLFFVSAFIFFSQAMPGGAPSAAAFVGFAAFMFLIVMIFTRNRIGARMRLLALDAVSEMRDRER
jgi:hypothetical protein